MSEIKFTPGPWSASNESWLNGHVDINSKTHGALALALCDMEDKNDPGYGEKIVELKANAHLIAAAPEMYDALSELMQIFDDELKLAPGSAMKYSKLLAKVRGEA